ncbi:MAG: methylmalonyl Co-A mutase-associated GTPase MeaB [Planctomycetes bacterium]|nr:methylmalonyl Co-A mutase-associated GTPase MeaB [Planctomycetota bacterium]
MDINNLVKRIVAADKLSISRAISMIENNSPDSDNLLDGIHKYVGRALRIGVTGPPGVGKSTIVNELIAALRKRDKRVGVIAVDPSSIFCGGAILGDRIRMQKIGVDNGVFIRSMATRGCSGGLSRATVETADIIEASGKDYIIIETVGVGQSEVEIFRSVDAVVLVLSPESGDAIQAMKAGIMEIADVIVVNKADRPGLDAFVTNLKNTLELARPQSVPHLCGSSKAKIPVLTAQANAGIGIAELLDTLEKYLSGLKESGKLAQRRRDVLRERIKTHILTRLEEHLLSDKKITKLVDNEIGKAGATPGKIAQKALRVLINRKTRKVLIPSKKRGRGV